VWWIDRALTLEREVACDDRVIDLTGSARKYASCLLRLATVRGGTLLPVVAPGATLGRSQLSRRIGRLLDKRRASAAGRLVPDAAVTTGVLLALTGAILSVGPVVSFARPPLPTPIAPRDGNPIARDISFADSVVEFRPPSIPGTRIAPAAPERRPHGIEQEGQGTMNEDSSVGRWQGGPAAPLDAGPGHVAVARDFNRPEAGGPPLPSSAVWAVSPVAGAFPTGLSDTQDPLSPGVESVPPDPTQSPPLWRAAADAGVAVGTGSRKAAVATAGFFSRFGKSIARSF
jgi:hypothetical protein